MKLNIIREDFGKEKPGKKGNDWQLRWLKYTATGFEPDSSKIQYGLVNLIWISLWTSRILPRRNVLALPEDVSINCRKPQ